MRDLLPKLREANHNLTLTNKNERSLVEIERVDNDDSSVPNLVLDAFPMNNSDMEEEKAIRVEMDLYLGVIDLNSDSDLIHESKSVLESKGFTIVDRDLEESQEKPMDVLERTLGGWLNRSEPNRRNGPLIEELSSDEDSDDI